MGNGRKRRPTQQKACIKMDNDCNGMSYRYCANSLLVRQPQARIGIDQGAEIVARP
jgi:hypothetical protein